jgi:hypothetical protein
MWPLGIVVVDVDPEHGLQVPPIQDEEPVQALGPAPRRADWRPQVLGVGRRRASSPGRPGLGLHQPEAHGRVALHRHRCCQVLLGPHDVPGVPVELAETEVAGATRGTHAELPSRINIAIPVLTRIRVRGPGMGVHSSKSVVSHRRTGRFPGKSGLNIINGSTLSRIIPLALVSTTLYAHVPGARFSGNGGVTKANG